MRQEDISILGFTLKHGGVGGLATSLFSLVLMLAGLGESGGVGSLVYVIVIGVILWAQIDYRRSEMLPVEYGDAFKVGAMTSLYIGVITIVYGLLHWNVIDPETGARALAAAEAAMAEQNLPPEQIEQAMAAQKMILSPVVAPVVGGIVTCIAGIIISLLSAIGTRRADELDAEEA